VFINCCHLGQMRGDASPRVAFHRLAANLATQFIKIGARAVVAAGWAVDDAAAKTFATSFYTLMLDGQLYGDAVLQARRDTFALHGNTNTWGAYQCYGDPSFSFYVGKAASRDETFVSESELGIWLDGITATARQADRNDEALKWLEMRVAQTPEEWWRAADVCAKAGAAYAEFGQFERAIDYYGRSLNAEQATGPLKAVEQLANCRVRWAGALLHQTEPNGKKAADELDKAEQTLRPLLAISETSERLSLLGGLMKRRAQLPGLKSADRRTALREMSAAYEKSYERSRQNGVGNPFPLTNHLAADIVLSWTANKALGKQIAKALAEYEQLAALLAAKETDPFILSGPADCLLLQALNRRVLDDAARNRIVQAFRGALSRGASSKVRDSMRTQFRFYRRLMETELPKEERAELIAQITALEEALL